MKHFFLNRFSILLKLDQRAMWVCACMLGVAINVYAQSNNSNTINAYLQTQQFLDPQGQPYIELQFQYVGNTLTYQQIDSANNDLSGEVAVIINITKDEKVVVSDAYRLPTPIMNDSTIEDFYDIKRFSLSPGNYRCHVEIIDMNAPDHPTNSFIDIRVDDKMQREGSISDILVAEVAYRTVEQTAFSRSGFDIIPRLRSFYPSEYFQIPYYAEVYWSMSDSNDSASDFSLVEQLLKEKTQEIIPEYTKISHHKKSSHVSIFKTFDITNLPSGSYLLRIATVDGDGRELAFKIYDFVRQNDEDVFINPQTLLLDPHFQLSISDDSTAYYLASLLPISSPQQARLIVTTLKEKKNDSNRKLIQAIWQQKDPHDTYQAWMRYKDQVMYVEQRFKTHFQSGFETDRGRVYLQYGQPNRVTEREISPSEYPYEMWEYNRIGHYNNRKFIFYNPDLLNNTYRLLHSDMIGELKNPSWQYDLNSRNNKRGNVDEPNEFNPDSWGNNARELLGK